MTQNSSSLNQLTDGEDSGGLAKDYGSNSRSYCGTAPGKIITVHSVLMLAAVGLAGGMLYLSRDTSQLVFSLVMCGIAIVMLLLWLSMCCRSYRIYRAGCKSATGAAAAPGATGKGDCTGAVREV
ncbi:hypothetical protein BOX15_Mlig033946g2 [Macrostomum lignano]|uniref:Uncharacterized protein n=1 Tax=Macrostomum lignano TaxID=282301 RepID=A0A267GL40_9PLAT|nr:hypothetical protein BOX15_Mlig033946g2 [Macrostomum lignano]